MRAPARTHCGRLDFPRTPIASQCWPRFQGVLYGRLSRHRAKHSPGQSRRVSRGFLSSPFPVRVVEMCRVAPAASVISSSRPRKMRPCISSFDDNRCCRRQRALVLGGGNDEREQTSTTPYRVMFREATSGIHHIASRLQTVPGCRPSGPVRRGSFEPPTWWHSRLQPGGLADSLRSSAVARPGQKSISIGSPPHSWIHGR